MPRILMEATRPSLCPPIDSSISLLDFLLLITINLVLCMFRENLLERNESSSFTMLFKGTRSGLYAYIAVSSANKMDFSSFSDGFRSLTYIINSNRLSTNPWGMPQEIFSTSQTILLFETNCRLLA